MAKHEVKVGQVDYSVLVFIPDAASTDGSGKTGLVAANLTVSGVRVETDNDVTVIDYTSSLNNLAALTTAHTDWGLLEVSSTLAPGLYRLDIADALFATGAWSCVVYVMVTTSAAAASPMEFVLIPQAPIDGVLLAPTTHTSAVIPTVTAVGTLTAYTGNTVQTGDSFARIGAAGAGLTAIDLPNQTMDITGNITGNLSGTVGSVTGAVGSIAAGGIATTSFAAGAIDAAAIAANAIGASELAADAVAEIADQVWDEVLAGHVGAGSTGEALGAAGGAGDPWITALPGAYGAGSAGKIVGDNVNATISSRASQTTLDTLDDLVDTEVGAIKTKTDLLPSDPADQSLIIAATDAIVAAIAALNNLSQANIRTAIGLASANLDTQLTTIDDLLDTEVSAIKAKTDSLTFTIANVLDANVQRINDVTITGDGNATPFGV